MHLGGTLYQDLPTEHPSNLQHRQKPPYDQPAHQVRLVPQTPLAEVLQADHLAVNSQHHQAIHQLAPTLKAMATAPDGLIEAAYVPQQPFAWGLQWHPECAYRHDEPSQAIFRALTLAAQKRA